MAEPGDRGNADDGAPSARPTPLERNRHQRLSSSAEIAAFLQLLGSEAPAAEITTLGHSVCGQPITALRIRPQLQAAHGAGPALRVLLVGSQHGASEAAGGEALLVIARALACGDLGRLRAALDLMLIPDANPDGRDLDSSKNGHDININRDFVLLSQPETRALNDALLAFAPHVVLDAHESAILKRKTLARQGYLTDFETQFDFGNNPAVPAALRAYCEQVLLPQLIAGTAAQGLAAQRYIREIVSVSQPITNGGLTARKFRNKAALAGALSFLLETRLDPKDGAYPTFRNIGVRVHKQVLCMRHFLAVVCERAAQIRTLLDSFADSTEAVTLSAEYALNVEQPTVRLPLREIKTMAVHQIEFSDHRVVLAGPSMPRPASFWITAHVAEFARLLARHGIGCTALSAPKRAQVVVQRYVEDGTPGGVMLNGEFGAPRLLPAGTLEIPVCAPHARLLPLLLDARSTSSVFRYPAYGALIPRSGEFFIFRAAE